MNNLFTPPALDRLKKTIDKSLKDTINFMFNFDICLRDYPKEPPGISPVQASVGLTAPDRSAILCVTIPNAMARELAAVLGQSDLSEEQMQQDIACEIANIIAHAVQGHFARPPEDVMFDVGLPQPGLVSWQVSQNEAGILRLPIPPNRENTMILDFIFRKTS